MSSFNASTCNRKKLGRRRSNRGAAAIEFALYVTVFVFIGLALIDGARIYAARAVLNRAVKIGLELAEKHPGILYDRNTAEYAAAEAEIEAAVTSFALSTLYENNCPGTCLESIKPLFTEFWTGASGVNAGETWAETMEDFDNQLTVKAQGDIRLLTWPVPGHYLSFVALVSGYYHPVNDNTFTSRGDSFPADWP